MRRPILLWIGIGVLAVIIIALGSIYSGLLGARVAPGLRFAITGPNQLIAGQPTTITWNTSTEGQAKYPMEKIEFCTRSFLRARCIVLSSRTPNDGEEIVRVPGIDPVSGYLQLTAIDSTTNKPISVISQSKPIQLIANTAEISTTVITPAEVGGSSLATLSAAGPRISVEQDGRYTILLPSPTIKKKIELCTTPARCLTLTTNITGTSTSIHIPANAHLGSSFIQVTEYTRNRLPGRVFFKRAVNIIAKQIVSEHAGEGSGSNGDGGNNGREGDSNNTSTPTPTTTAIPTTISSDFIVPVNGDTVESTNNLDVRVQLSNTTDADLVCQQWTLNGEVITQENWVPGQAPRVHSQSCN
ncbi:MAG: hypothetical protein ABIP54_05170 [Candidatus Andersenbacteria bacterium]